MKKIIINKGQSLIELMVAIGVFMVVVSVLGLLVFNSYTAGRLALEITKANFLAEEGLEAVRSIRDNSWVDIPSGYYGLDNLSGSWQFLGASETIDGKYERTINVDDSIGPDRKKITSKVAWQFTESMSQEVQLITYLTNWQKVLVPPGLEILRPTLFIDTADRTDNEALAYDGQGTTFSTTDYGNNTDPSIVFHTWGGTSETYNSLVLKYRYHVDAGVNDTYAVSYSIDGGFSWIDLILPTSAGVLDTTLPVIISPSQDLSQLQVKIYTSKTAGPDNSNIYTRDIWTEGSF